MWCSCCGETKALVHRCSLKFCPVCAWRITEKRKLKLAAWSRCVKNPQHIVLTQRNFETLNRGKIREHYKNLTKIRRHQLFKQVRGGCCSVEITNKGEGWHLHSHWLVDAPFIDYAQLSIAWGNLCGQEFGIVHGKKITSAGYEKEILKYVCKPSELASWTGQQILDFILSIRRSRFFFAFGSLFKDRARIKAMIEEMKIEREKPLCTNCENEYFVYIPDKTMRTESRMKFA